MKMDAAKINSFPWHRSVVLRLIGFIILCIALAQGIAVYITTQQDDGVALEHFFEHHELSLNAYSELAGNLVWRLQFEQLQKVAETLMVEHSVIRVEIRDLSGELVASAHRNAPELQEDPGDIVSIRRDIFQRNSFIEERAGTIEIVASKHYLVEESQSALYEKIFIFLISAAAIIIGTLFAARRMLSKPLAELNAAIERSENGEIGVRVEPRKMDEVGALFRSFNGFMQSSEKYNEMLNSANQRLSQLALKDELTGLYNRRAALEKFLALQGKSEICVIFIDVDHFKSINDLYGHDGGDTLLSSLATRIAQNIDPENAAAYRIGGDEFIVVREGLSSAAEAQDVANELLTHLNGSYATHKHQLQIAVSIGVYFCEDALDGFDEVVAMASRALRRAKSTGRGKSVLLDAKLRDEARERIELSRAVQVALDDGSFETFYQTRHCAKTGRVIGAEALSRCVLPDGSLIGPAEFMPVIEESQHSLEHGAILLGQVCQTAGQWRKQFGEGFRLSLNMNAQQLAQPEFWRLFANEREKHQLSATFFEVEITESSLIQNFRLANDVLRKFREEGGLVALDDFGTGYSSLSYLTKLPIDIIKLDRGFVASALRDTVSAGILQASVLLAGSIGAKIVAEGVENPEDAAFMRAAGVDYLQGFFYSKPLPLKLVLAKFDANYRASTIGMVP